MENKITSEIEVKKAADARLKAYAQKIKEATDKQKKDKETK